MIEFKKFDSGLEYIKISNAFATAKISLKGATLFSYKKVGEDELFWVSEANDFDNNSPIRGGVPICWPWFGSTSLPPHGFARDSRWEFVSYDEPNGVVVFKLDEPWEYRYSLVFSLKIGKTLSMKLSTTNLDTREFSLSQALHSYFNISDISSVKVSMLDGKSYLDALDFKQKNQNGDIVIDKEIDRVYSDVDGAILVDKHRAIHIKNSGSKSIVVWNPWVEKTKRLRNMLKDDYKKMLCIESANAFSDARVLKPNETHTLATTISLISES
ncbi:MAG: D-hexose-6-phosphate mutarotase [Sulfurimonas sp.]